MSCFKNIKCNSEIVEDDTNYNCKGNYDVYLYCENCLNGSEFE